MLSPRRTAQRMLAALGLAAAAAAQQTDPAEAPPQDQVLATQPASQPASRPADDEPAPDKAPRAWYEAERLTGDWGGVRPWLEEHGITFDSTFSTYYQHVARGGLQTHNAHTIIGVNDFELTLDLGKMKVLPGGRLYLWGSNAWGESPSTRGWTGDLFWVNGAEVGDRPIDVHELWYEQSFLDDKVQVRFGKISLPMSFDTNEFANWPSRDFVNYGLNNAPNIPFPAFAFGALGAQAFIRPCDLFYFGAGAADAEGDFRETGLRTGLHGPAHFFGIFEAGLTPTFETPLGKLPGHYRAGLWYDPTVKEEFFNDLDGRREIPLKNGDVGFYVNLDQQLWREAPSDPNDAQGLGVFARYGHANDDVNWIEHFWSVGGQYRGPIPTRDEDVLGVGVAQGLLSPNLSKIGLDPHHETVIEAYYSIQLFPWLTVSPDFQWILRPGGENGRDAFVAGLRLTMSF
ncbi:MAG: carbohydrate porin [Phycisphaerae bacterium]